MQFLTKQAAAHQIGRSEKYLERAAARGDLTVYRVGAEVRYDAAEVHALTVPKKVRV